MTAAPATTAISTTIIAFDLGKYKSVAGIYTGDPAQARFLTLTTDRNDLAKLFAHYRPAAVVIEACQLAGWVHDLCHELGLTCHVANTASEAWKFKHPKRKTDVTGEDVRTKGRRGVFGYLGRHKFARGVPQLE